MAAESIRWIVAAAMPAELAIVRRVFTEARPETVVVPTGVGPKRAAAAVRRSLRNVAAAPACCATVVLSTGFCGAADPSLRVGDWVIPTDVVRLGGLDGPREVPESNRLRRHLNGCGSLSLHGGRLATAASFVATREDKLRLHREHGIAAIDMESAAVGRVADEAGMGWAVLRVVSDDASGDIDVPDDAARAIVLAEDLGQLVSSGLQAWRHVPEVLRLARDMATAAGALRQALQAVAESALRG